MGTMQYQFPSEDAAKKFIRSIAWQYQDVACMRQGTRVWVIDGTHLHARDMLHIAATFGGHPV